MSDSGRHSGKDWGAMLRYALFTLTLPLLVLAAVYKAHTYYGLPVGTLLRDPSAVTNVPWYVGVVSNLGVLLWCAAGAVCAFAAALLLRSGGGARRTAFLGCAASVSLLLMFDDLLMLHEAVLPQTFSIGEHVFLGLDAALLALFLAYFVRDILDHDWPILAGALVLFAVSMLLDRLRLQITPAGDELMEDGSKFLGAALWLGFWARTAHQAIRRFDRRAGAGLYSIASKESDAHGDLPAQPTHANAGA